MAHDLSIETVYGTSPLPRSSRSGGIFRRRQITNRFGFIDIKREKAIAEQSNRRSASQRRLVDSTVANLSGGERPGIAIGRAMHYDADLIILDEPTVALAVASAQGARFHQTN